MILYLAGNFPQLKSIGKEQAMAELTEIKGSGYHRLMTFYYRKDCKTIFTVCQNLKNKPKKIIKRGSNGNRQN